MNSLERRLAIADKAINLGLTSAELKDQVIDWHLFGIKNTVSASIIEERALEVKRLRDTLVKMKRLESNLETLCSQVKLELLNQQLDDCLDKLER